jgi:hypothetical protein
LIHAQDNGMVIAVEDSNLRHAGSVVNNAFPFGIFALASPRNTAAVCQTCGKELARNAIGWKFGEQIAKQVKRGTLVWRYLPEQTTPAYDPNATRA